MTAQPPRRTSVLIVDDSPGVLLAMEKLLSPYVPVKVAESAAAALKHLTPDTALVLTDVRMPDMDGLELTRALRAKHPNLPVVFMTGIVEDGLRSEAKALGVLDVLRKPLKPGVILPALQEWLADELPIPMKWESVSTHAPETPAEHQAANAALQTHGSAGGIGGTGSAGHSQSGLRNLPPLTSYLTGIAYLPGVMLAAAFDPEGKLLSRETSMAKQVGQYVRFLTNTMLTLGEHLQAEDHLKAIQVEYSDRVLVVVPAPNGCLVVLVRDTPAASSVKAWLRTHLQENNTPYLN